VFERLADGTLVPLKGQTDWERLKALTDDEVEAMAAADTEENPPMTDEEWEAARVGLPLPCKQALKELDAAIGRGIADAEAGRAMDADEAFAKLREELFGKDDSR
jgi:hypothetical protein